MDGLPSFSFLGNQPGWVVIVTVALVVLGALALALLRSRKPRADDKTPSAGDNQAAVLVMALEESIMTARRASEKNQKLSSTLRDVRKQLAECERERGTP